MLQLGYDGIYKQKNSPSQYGKVSILIIIIIIMIMIIIIIIGRWMCNILEKK
jgi:flagellar basal body-associated protein FliL